MREIRRGARGDIPAVTAIYDRILKEEAAGRSSVGRVRGVYPTESTAREALAAGVAPCAFNGIPGVGLVCLEKRLEG